MGTSSAEKELEKTKKVAIISFMDIDSQEGGYRIWAKTGGRPLVCLLVLVVVR